MKWKWTKHCTRRGLSTADDNSASNDRCFNEAKSPSLIHLHHQHLHHRRQTKASLGDVAMHFSPPPSKDSINTDFTNLNAISEAGRNSMSRQSLIGEFRSQWLGVCCWCCRSVLLVLVPVLSAVSGFMSLVCRHHQFTFELFASLPMMILWFRFFLDSLLRRHSSNRSLRWKVLGLCASVVWSAKMWNSLKLSLMMLNNADGRVHRVTLH